MTVIFCLIDALRPDAIHPERTPHLSDLINRGSSTLVAQSVMPSLTLPCHFTLFHSVPPERHGITDNSYHPPARPVNGLFETAALAGKHCAAFYNWEPLRDLNRPGSLRHSFFNTLVTPDIHADRGIAQAAAEYLQTTQPDFAFVYFGAVDIVGHIYGWMSAEYLAQVQATDAALGHLLAALPTDAHILVQADHGGHANTHGTDLPEDMTIPWVVFGPRIKPDHKIQQPITLLDTAPTLAALLNIRPDPEWQGQPVQEVFIS